MSRNATDNTTEHTDVEESDRYAELTICGDEYVIYDRKNHQAWIQSTLAVPTDDIR